MLTFRVKRTLRMGFKSLWLHKLRSMLTVLGIVCGVCSVIAMLAIGEGASYEAQRQIRELGSQNIIINSVKPPEEKNVTSQQTWALKYGITYVDAERIQSTVPNVEVTVPSRNVREHISYLERRVDGLVVGTEAWYPDVANRSMLRGRFFTAVDMHAQAPVCVLNEPIVRELFPFADPLGDIVRAGGEVYRVIGILRAQSKGAVQSSGGDQPTTGYEVYIPMTTAQARYGNVIAKRRSGNFEATIIDLHRIIVRVEKLEDVVPVSRAIEAILRHSHERKDYQMVLPLELLEQARATKRRFAIVLGSIAAISLLVGGIGIMNIMLATVTERTREIGIRRALGARQRDIVMQFLSETVLLSAGGGLLGVGVGVLIPFIVTYFSDMLTIVTPFSCILAFSISVGVGLVFGMYPAYRAAAMDPIQALRHE
jgi:putative ABC transport system permease protein